MEAAKESLVRRLRRSRAALIGGALVIATWLLMGLLILMVSGLRNTHGAGVPRTEDTSDGFRTFALLSVFVPLFWWGFAVATGHLWRMRPDWSWKLFFAAGAFGLFVMALLYDLVLYLAVEPLYQGSKPIVYSIFQSERTEPPKTDSANA